MARINIEDSLHFDPRFQAVVQATGSIDTAIGMACRLFRLAQKYWGDDRQLIPLHVFRTQKLDIFLETGLAIGTEEGVYVCGTKEHLEWFAERKDAAKEGGKRSAAARLRKNGTAIPSGARNNPTEAKPNQTEAKPNPLALALALAQQDKVNTATSSSNHSTQNNPPPVRSRSATSPEKRIGFKATKAAVKVIGTMQLIGERENEAARALGEDIYAALLSKYPVNTWGQVCASYRAMASKGRESFFEADLVRLFEAHFWEGEVPDRGPAGMSTQAPLPVAPGSRKAESQLG